MIEDWDVRVLIRRTSGGFANDWVPTSEGGEAKKMRRISTLPTLILIRSNE